MDKETQRKKKVDYNIKRLKELGYKTFGTKLAPEEYKEISSLLKKKNMNKADLIRYGYKKLKEED